MRLPCKPLQGPGVPPPDERMPICLICTPGSRRRVPTASHIIWRESTRRFLRGALNRLEQPPAERLADLRRAVAALDHQAGDALLLAEGAEPLGDVVADKALQDQDEPHPMVADPTLERV